MELTWLGLDRHAWGAVHLYLAFLLLSLLLLHVILHGKMILGLFTRFISDPTLRKGSAPIFLVLSLILLAFPLLVTPEVNEVGVKRRQTSRAINRGIPDQGRPGWQPTLLSIRAAWTKKNEASRKKVDSGPPISLFLRCYICRKPIIRIIRMER